MAPDSRSPRVPAAQGQRSPVGQRRTEVSKLEVAAVKPMRGWGELDKLYPKPSVASGVLVRPSRQRHAASHLQVRFQWKNPDFLLRNPDLLSGILISY